MTQWRVLPHKNLKIPYILMNNEKFIWVQDSTYFPTKNKMIMRMRINDFPPMLFELLGLILETINYSLLEWNFIDDTWMTSIIRII